MTDAKLIFESEYYSTARGGLVDESTEFRLWFEKLAFAISKQRFTLAGQEMAALGDVYQRGLLVTEVLKDKLNNNNNNN